MGRRYYRSTKHTVDLSLIPFIISNVPFSSADVQILCQFQCNIPISYTAGTTLQFVGFLDALPVLQ